MYTKSYIVSNNDVDNKFLLKVPAIFRYFQDVALLATEESKVDSISLSQKNIDWVITRMKVEIIRLPKCDEEIFDGTIELRVHDRQDVSTIVENLKKVEGLQEINQIV